MAAAAAAAALHQELLLPLNADCAEFCPHAGGGGSGGAPRWPDWLGVGTYQLDEASGERQGRLYLFGMCHGDGSGGGGERGAVAAAAGEGGERRTEAGGGPHLVQLASLDLPGVFDLQWAAPEAGRPPRIGLALADGSLRLVEVAGGGDDGGSGSGGPSGLREVCRCRAAAEGMALSLAWAVQPLLTQQQQQQQQPQQQQGEEQGQQHRLPPPPPEQQQQQQQQQVHQQQMVAVSSSAGGISLVQAREAGLQRLCEWTGHELEAWMASWDAHQPHVVYSGGDDCAIKGWDVRAACGGGGGGSAREAGEAPEHTPIFSNRRAHGAGVCCISSHPRRPHVLATGSYDDAARLWDVRMLQRPLQTCQVDCGGGVWRLKWHPTDDRLLLAACMYNGFALLAADEGWSGLQMVEQYKGHESIAYGADWYRGGGGGTEEEEEEAVGMGGLGGGGDLVATCSFYDCRLHLWSPATRAHGSCEA